MGNKKKSTMYKKKEPDLPKDATLSHCLDLIVEAARDSKLSQTLFDNYQQHISFVADRLNLTADAVVLLALLMNRAYDYMIKLDEIMEDLDCSYFTIVKRIGAIDELRAAGYIKGSLSVNDSDDVSFNVPFNVVKAISANEPYVNDLSGLTQHTLLYRIKRLYRDNCDDKLSHSEFEHSINDLFCYNPDVEIVKAFKKWGFFTSKLNSTGFAMLGFCYATLFINDDVTYALLKDGEEAYFVEDYERWQYATEKLVAKGLIQNSFCDGLADAKKFCMTRKARAEFLAGTVAAEAKSNAHTIKACDVVEKEMYYNGKEAADIERLYSLIEPKRFKQVQQALSSHGMRTGFACLLYGSPGTGKTETALQLARRSGRDIMRVDVTSIRSKWVGDSERNIKQAFDQYNELCDTSEVAPILLFNEADAVLGSRIKGAPNSVDRMENSVQNIILQEMEDLKGIMIATSNLNENFDPAFERRFLYKIEFTRPSAKVRCNIWKSMIPDLTDKEALTLAGRYDLSGGEIENVARKLLVERLLNLGAPLPTLQLVAKICDSEGSSCIRRAVGF